MSLCTDGVRIIETTDDEGKKLVATLSTTDNAHLAYLLASAPYLLEALKKYVDDPEAVQAVKMAEGDFNAWADRLNK